MRPAFRQLRSARTCRLMQELGIFVACLLICLVLPNASAQTPDAGQTYGLESLSLTTDAVAPRRFVAVHGRRALIDGYAGSGLEVWAYPVQLIQNYRIGFQPQGMTSEIPGATVLRRIIYRPNEIVRIYIGPDFLVWEKLFVPLNKPDVILTYTVESRNPVDIIVHFVPVLNLMWPAGIGGQDVTWGPTSSGYMLSEQTHRFSAVVGSTAIVAHDEILNRADSSSAQGSLAFTIRPSGSSSSRTAVVVVASSDGNAASLNTLVKTLTDTASELEKEAVSHYADLRSSIVQIETPDVTLNQDFAWAEVALDQAWVCNPYLGCGLVAGYGPSRGARRPQYAWFFAGDAMVAVRALLSAGEYTRAREALEFIAKYQDPKTGMIWHEMSQSAGLIDWTGKYPYMFVHVDISFQYLNTVAAYVAASGDKKFLQDHWQSVSAAYRYCQSLIDARDDLPHIPPGKEGGDEQDRMSDELTLSASWIEASKSFVDMATWMGDATQATQAMQASEKARESAATRYWDPKSEFWIDGHSPSGKEIVNRSSSGNVVIVQHLFSQQQQQSLLDQLASPSFQTDWGTRSTATNSSVFNPDSYAKGSVWAVGTAEMAMAFWAGHRPIAALSIWSGLIPWSSLDSLGHMDEVLAGDYYHEQTESVPEQTWSSASFFQTAVQGLLGLRVNALQDQINFSPHLPADWNTVSVRKIQLPQSKITLIWTRTNNGSELEAVNSGPPVHLVYSPEIPLGSKLTGAILNGKPIHAGLENHSQDTHATVDLDLPHGTSHLSLAYSGGISLLLPRTHPLLGNSSRAMKVIGVKLHRNTYIVDAQIDADNASSFELRTDRKVLAVHNATWKAISSHTYALTIAPASSEDHPHSYSPVEIVVDLAPLR
jgi:glycogen debranching enzyme